MKTKLCVLIILLAAALVQAQTNNLTVLLQQGLFEEQANRNLDAAIADYTSLATQFDKDRQLAATAVFRLGECYRALGKTNEAAAQYQRILKDFSDEQTLATLSRQNLTGMGISTPSTTATVSAAGMAQQRQLLGEEIKLVEQQLATQQAQVKVGVLPTDGVFTTQQKVLELKRQLAALDSNRADLLNLSVPTTSEEDQEIQRIQQMIQNSPDLINARVDGKTPLAKAAANGWLKVAAYLMDHGADVNRSYALSAAVAAGNRAMVELLLSRGANVSEMDNSNGGTLLQTAVQKGYQSVAEVLLANKADVNAQANSGDTALTTASSVGQVKIVKMLLAAGANPNLVGHDDNGTTIGGRRGGRQPTLQGRTALSFAAERGSPEMVKMLLDAKADPNGGNLDAPLLSTIYRQDAASAELLLQAGANPNGVGAVDFQVRPMSADFMNHSGHLTPLWLAIYMKQLPMVQLLLKYKADPNDSQTDGKPLLFSALSDTNILETLLVAGAKVDARDTVSMAGDNRRMNRTPLIETVVTSHWPPAVEILLKHRADPNARDGFGQAPLHYATGIYENSHSREIIELLLAYKADPNVRNEGGQTPLDLLKRFLAQNTSASGLPAPGQNSSPEQIKLAGELADLLRQHGALDKLPDWDRITVSRPSANFSQAVFGKNTNDWNQFTLLEAVLNFYQPQYSPYQPRQIYPGTLAFPDLAQVTIVRHRPGTTNEMRIKMNLLNSTNGIDCAKDVPLEFGDVVEIPERNHALGDQAVGLTASEAASISDYLKGNVQLLTHGQKVELPIYPSPAGSLIGFVMQNQEAQKVLLSSSDLSRIKVIRRDSKTSKRLEWILDCTGAVNSNGNNTPDLWLRNGDVIEVPEKP